MVPVMAFSTPSDIPLIDEALGDELFASQGDAEITRMQQQIWREVRQGIGPGLKKALGGEPFNLKANLHRIRGYCATCALRRLEKVLLEWESQPCVARPHSATDRWRRRPHCYLSTRSKRVIPISDRPL
jgi:hypothetical protein